MIKFMTLFNNDTRIVCKFITYRRVHWVHVSTYAEYTY